MSECKKPRALGDESRILVISPASPSDKYAVQRGCAELSKLGLSPIVSFVKGVVNDGYFAAPLAVRLSDLVAGLATKQWDAVFCARGGYGSTYLLDSLDVTQLGPPKIFLGYSDVNCLQVFLWQKLRWVTFYGPMVAAGFDAGPGVAGGFDLPSFLRALTETENGWSLDLQGETLLPGEARGSLVGGCLSLIQTTLATPWELDTNGSILLLEDRAMKPYQVDRALVHLKQAGKFNGVCGVVLGEFPEGNSPDGQSASIRDVCQRVLAPLEIPVVWGAAIGHSNRAMLTVPLGVRACLRSSAGGVLNILEPAVTA